MSSDDNHTEVTVPDDLSSMPDETGGMWHLHIRLVLRDGETLMRVGQSFPYEPHHGDVMHAGGYQVGQTFKDAKQEGYLKFLPDDDGMFFTALDNVQGIYIDVMTPDGDEICAADLKSGFHGHPHPA